MSVLSAIEATRSRRTHISTVCINVPARLLTHLSHEAKSVPKPHPRRDLQSAPSQAPRVHHKRQQQCIAPPAQASTPPDDSPFDPAST